MIATRHETHKEVHKRMGAKPKSKPKVRRPRGEPRPLPPLPTGTDAILGPSEAAAALGMRRLRFRQLLNKGQVPPPDGKTPWNGHNFWRQSTINKFIESMSSKESADGRGIQAGERQGPGQVG
jgi:hypothetical protein